MIDDDPGTLLAFLLVGPEINQRCIRIPQGCFFVGAAAVIWALALGIPGPTGIPAGACQRTNDLFPAGKAPDVLWLVSERRGGR
jgi:hypothetical protein